MANWFEVRAGTLTEAAARAYFRASNYLKSMPVRPVIGVAGYRRQPIVTR